MKESAMSLIHDPDLDPVLTDADSEDLRVLIDHITDKGNGRISLASSTQAALMAGREQHVIDIATRAVIAEELSRFGGNSLMNLFRMGGGVAYHELARDVADRLGTKLPADASVEAVELGILQKLAEQSVERMSEDDKVNFFRQFGMRYAAGSGAAASAGLLASIAASNAASYHLSTLVANGVMKAILGRGLTAGLGSAAGAASFLGPAAMVVSVLWGLYGLTSAAYRVTVPCVIHIAYMRRRKLAAGPDCPSCNAPAAADARFCGACGASLARGKHPRRATGPRRP